MAPRYSMRSLRDMGDPYQHAQEVSIVRTDTCLLPNERAHLKSRAAGAQLATVAAKPPTRDPGPEQRLEVQRLVLLRLYAVVSSHPQIPGSSGGCRRRSAKALAHQRAPRCYAQVPWRCG